MPIASVKRNNDVDPVSLDELPGAFAAHQPGEPGYRCLWCMRYRCHGPLEQCAECRLEYERAAKRMGKS